uniref:Predicted protein n=1 Tax=Hordeum vulgare subsp. vulgare TaxID=112509 RepID=F2DZN6_HORVV|nr:predicted protein [Hordeum vulgare subsp. vulgare]
MPSLQTLLLLVSSGIMIMTGSAYLKGHLTNDFAALRSLFLEQIGDACTTSECWFTLGIFMSLLYSSLAIIGFVAAFFFGQFEQSVVLGVFAYTNLVMAGIRQFVMPARLYRPGSTVSVTLTQVVVGLCSVVAIVLSVRSRKNKTN